MRLKFWKIKDHTKKYWEQVANKDMPEIMEKICHTYSQSEFENKKVSIIFDFGIKFDKSMTVLDLGCGLGRTCRWVAPQVFCYIGIDNVDEMIFKAKIYNSNFPNAEFMIRDGETLLPKSSIDVVYSEIAFQHMSKNTQRNYIVDLKTILKPKGIFYVQLPKKENYPVGWKKSEINELFSGWNYEILKVNNPKHDANYLTIKAQICL